MRFLLPALALFASPALAAAPVWTLDKGGSTLGFSGSVNGQAFTGRFRRWDAQIRFDTKDLAGSSVLVAVDTGSAATGDKTLDEALPTSDWFSIAAFPRATFEAHRFIDQGGGRYQAIGSLTIRDQRRPVTVSFQLRMQGGRSDVEGGLTLDRHSFGIGQGQFSTADMVAFPVDVRFELSAKGP